MPTWGWIALVIFGGVAALLAGVLFYIAKSVKDEIEDLGDNS